MINIKETSWHYRLYRRYSPFTTNDWYAKTTITLCSYVANVFLGGIVAVLASIVIPYGIAFLLEGPFSIFQYFKLGMWAPFFFIDPEVAGISAVFWGFALLVVCVVGAFLGRERLKRSGKLEFLKRKKSDEPTFFSLLAQRIKDKHDNICTMIQVPKVPRKR